MCTLNNHATYFDSYGVEHIPKEFNNIVGKSTIITNIFRVQAYYSVMCIYFFIEFINFMFKDKRLTDFTNLFSPNSFKKNDGIILNYLMTNFMVLLDTFFKKLLVKETLLSKFNLVSVVKRTSKIEIERVEIFCYIHQGP